MKDDNNKPSTKITVYIIVTDIIVQMLSIWLFFTLINCEVDITYTLGDVVWFALFSEIVRGLCLFFCERAEEKHRNADL